jgi:tripartite-type tricarboxylate transporter receptor subunit TctC
MALKNAAPDGTTIALLPIALPVVVPLIVRDVAFDPLHDFAPVSQIARYTFAIAVPANHPAKTVGELMAWLKSHPDKAFYGTAAAGSVPHFLGVEIAKATGVDMAAVAYKGPYPMSIDLIAGVIPAGISAIGDFIEMHRAGKLRILATSGTSRLPQLPDVPTFLEQGLPIQASGWVAAFAPAKTPKRVIDQWSAALASAVRSPQTQAQFLELGLEPTGTTADELEKILAADIARWTPIIKASGFHAD